MAKTVNSIINFGFFCLTALVFSFILIVTFRLSEKYTAHMGLIIGTLGTVYFQIFLSQLRGKKAKSIPSESIKKTFCFLLISEIIILIVSPLHSLIPEKVLVKTGILKNINLIKECPFEQELAKAKSFMQNEIDLSGLKIYYGGDSDVASRFHKFLPPIKATTWGNIIYVSRKEPCVSDSLLVHELAHVWQYQNGYGFGPKWIYLWPYYYLGYLTDFDSMYDFGSYEGLIKAKSEGKEFKDFGLEQQAEIVETYYYVVTRYGSPDLNKSEQFKALQYFVHQEFNF